MKSLYLRIWLTVVAALALFALASGWLLQRHLDQERVRSDAQMAERMAAWGELLQGSLPEAWESPQAQAEALKEWSRRLRLPLALDAPGGSRIGASDSYLRREVEPGGLSRAVAIRLDDGRTLWLVRPGGRKAREVETVESPPGNVPMIADGSRAIVGAERPGFGGAPPDRSTFLGLPVALPPDWPASLSLLLLLSLLFLGVAAGAWPVVRSLTRRLESLQQGVEAFGAGALHHRVKAEGSDEVAAVAQSFNRAAERIETLVQTHQRLLANASHELRSPLARLRMAVEMYESAGPAQRAALKTEIDTNVSELDALVEEVLLSSRLDAGAAVDLGEQVDLIALLAEEAARVAVPLSGEHDAVQGNERLLRRAVRNLLENARRYAGDEVNLQVVSAPEPGHVDIRVCDRGPGVPADQREKIFEPFYRMPGHAEREGGVGLGLSLVRQIAHAHRGRVFCEPNPGGGSCFVIRLPQS
ncbi:MAG: two-component sensor histidine kinase [Ideonella sp. MAG2]|nr:MAG: two-component sensor histidine kinase [Ideonella sp. MAG2]